MPVELAGEDYSSDPLPPPTNSQ